MHQCIQLGAFCSACRRILGVDADVKDHGFVANRSGNPRDTRRGEEIEIADLKRPRRQGEHRGLSVYVRSVVNVYDGAVGRIIGG
jgi:hypothetical protein